MGEAKRRKDKGEYPCPGRFEPKMSRREVERRIAERQEVEIADEYTHARADENQSNGLILFWAVAAIVLILGFAKHCGG